MRRFLAPAAVAGMVVAGTLFGGPALGVAPDASAESSSAHTSSQPGPWPPDIPPPLCVPKDQSDGTYEWQYSGKRTLGSSIVYEYVIGYATPVVNNLTLVREVDCKESAGRVGSGLGLKHR